MRQRFEKDFHEALQVDNPFLQGYRYDPYIVKGSAFIGGGPSADDLANCSAKYHNEHVCEMRVDHQHKHALHIVGHDFLEKLYEFQDGSSEKYPKLASCVLSLQLMNSFAGENEKLAALTCLGSLVVAVYAICTFRHNPGETSFQLAGDFVEAVLNSALMMGMARDNQKFLSRSKYNQDDFAAVDKFGAETCAQALKVTHSIYSELGKNFPDLNQRLQDVRNYARDKAGLAIG